ncbi:MAG: hypothetical protein OEZ59_13240 [Deltaproteobacteria bacterium]|nr:hypothetical protein [Deltaproteobacteria bacterium]
MKVSERTLEFDATLWVQHSGVDVARRGDNLAVTAREEEAWLKVFNHFGRLHKLYIFEEGRWIDGDTGAPPEALDEAEAGHLAAPANKKARTGKTGGKTAARAGGKSGKKAPENPAPPAARTGRAKPGGKK